MNSPVPELNLSLSLLAQTVVQELSAKGLTCATAESCTGGLIGHLLTEVSGSSACFWGSAVTYSYEAKQQVLGVDWDLMEAKGAVSVEVAQKMAKRAWKLFAVDIAVSVTGVAGPGGGSIEKPVGTVFLYVQGPSGIGWGVHHIWEADRAGNKLLSAEAALQLILDCAQELPSKTHAA